MTNVRESSRKPIASGSMNDLLTPGVIVILSHEAAALEGAFFETALDPADAWASNIDLASAHVG